MSILYGHFEVKSLLPSLIKLLGKMRLEGLSMMILVATVVTEGTQTVLLADTVGLHSLSSDISAI